MQRRELLEAMMHAALAAGLLGQAGSLQAHAAGCDGKGPGDAAELRRQLQYWARYDSSELGVPMWLALESLAPGAGQPAYVPGPLNQQLAAQFERYVDLLLQYKSEPEESDVAALVVLLAEQQLVPAERRACA